METLLALTAATVLICTTVITWRAAVIWHRLDWTVRVPALLFLALFWAFAGVWLWAAWSLG